ncbi:LysM peptidoglycan-binding domain-containing protein [Paenibacillus sp. JX-17]|uniref:LysM peptidoglycan-binding domain-containing protein n=1 Tax=Paenibacillus lacisoli TaxID=3064525 RepID=A0ABT9C6P4_9BACL|nr:LysM peptidoglycan-binding domain-containing protein [Paenibacillus sp. JX-17]MDO7904939.1 LysM peptidoglycan-binding domain-containing protein [Paenibacillus sp. JX-17]
MLKYSTYQSIYNKNETSTQSEPKKMVSLKSNGSLCLKIIALLIVVGITCSGVIKAFAGSAEPVGSGQQIVVEQGDTLWEIAVSHKPKTMDTRVYIEAIKMASGMTDSSIETGQILVLPEL